MESSSELTDYGRGGEHMARVPDVARRRFFSGTPLDTLNLFYTIAIFQKEGVLIASQTFHVRRAAFFSTEIR